MFLSSNKILKIILSQGSFYKRSIMASSFKDLPSTAGIIIIGDEILKGQTQDTNTLFITKFLYKLGVKVNKVSVLPDNINVIANEISSFSKEYTHVITSGGIGPTHDDITMQGVAEAFGKNLHYHPLLVKFISDYFKTEDMKSPAMKMAYIPEGAELHFGQNIETGKKSKFPIISVENVTIFPGIPHLLESAFTLIGKKLFYKEGFGFHTKEMYLNSDEVSIAPFLNKTVEAYPDVTFGSYPDLFHSYYITKISIESLSEKMLKEAEEHFRSQLNKDLIVNYISDTITDPWPFLETLPQTVPSITKQLETAYEVLEKCYRDYKPEEICVCYNGGKDCLAVLHLAYCMHKKYYPTLKLQAVHITEPNAFPQANEFVQQSINRYNLDCITTSGPIKDAFYRIIEDTSIKATIMGSRLTDPYSVHLEAFSKTDSNWPPLMRVNPILNWNYDDVWSFIRGLYLPYCSLYDRGYTSLGNRKNTVPNPALETKTRGGEVTYLPAYRLNDTDLEREGRK